MPEAQELEQRPADRRPSAHAGAPTDPRAGRPAGPHASRHTPATARAKALTVAVGVCAAVPVLVSTARALIQGWTPAGDQAIIATRAYDVLTSHTPLVGQHSDASAVTHHTLYSLGPMLYWLLALPARYGSPETLALTIGVVNALAIVGVVAFARRRGGWALMFAVAIAVVLMCESLASELFHDVWNPSAGLFPFTLLIFMCWSLACGEHRLLPGTALVVSYVVQCQLGYLAPSLGMLAVGMVGLAVSVRTRRPRRYGSVWGWACAALIVVVVCWAPPVIQQIEDRPGNMTVAVNTVKAGEPTLGATVGWRAVVLAIGVPPWWLEHPGSPWQRKFEVRAKPGTVASVSCVLMLGALLAIAAVGLVRRRSDLWAGALIALVLCGALAAVAASTPTTPLLAATLGYTLWWGSPAGMFVWVVLGYSAATLLGGPALSRLRARAFRAPPFRAPASVLAAGVGAAGILAVAAVGTAVALAEDPDFHLWEYRPLRAMFAGLERGMPAGRTVLLVGSLDNTTFRFKMAARYALLRRGIRPLSRGASVRLDDWYEPDHHHYDCTVYVDDGSRRPARHAVAVTRVSFEVGARFRTVTVWSSRARCA